MAALGGVLIHRGATGYCPAVEALSWEQGPVRIDETISVLRPPEEAYEFWRNLENLPRVMRHLESVTSTGAGRSHWVAKGPAGSRVEWDAEITNERPPYVLEWRSLEGSDIECRGSVRFTRKHRRGTKIHVNFEYRIPGTVGPAVAKLFKAEPASQVAEDLQCVKAALDAA
jgi:uncharacterized membrane protein